MTSVRKGLGPIPARVMIVGEAYSDQESLRGEPFLGNPGEELNRLLHEAGFMRSECYLTNAVNARPPASDPLRWIALKKSAITTSHILYQNKWVLPIVREGIESLREEISRVKPSIIIALGNFPLWALTLEWGILKWRGSMLPGPEGSLIIPTYHPKAIFQQWELRATALLDLKRARKELDSPTPLPRWNFHVRPTFEKTLNILCYLQALVKESPTWIDLDLETRFSHIACCGLSWSRTDALCIPFMESRNPEGYWNQEEEAVIVWHLYKLLTHPNCLIRWQNGLYDAQYIYRYWHFIPNGKQDTMLSQHTMFPGLKKSLDFQASMYCEHYSYWKDDGKEWSAKMSEDILWKYNCQDCVRTREVGEVEAQAITKMGLSEVEAFQQQLFYPVLQAMIWGVRVDLEARNRLIQELQDAISEREAFFLHVLGHSLNPASSAQMKNLFYEDLQQPPIMSRAKKNSPAHVTCDDEALDKIAKREPILRPLIDKIREYRSLGVFLSTFVLAPLDVDNRMRCSYNIAKVETFRLASSANAFGTGTNLQNIPKGDESGLYPNVRQLYIPDSGYTFFDMDLDRADLQVVVWEADDKELKMALREGLDMHCFNAVDLFDIKGIPVDELKETHPNYLEHRNRIGYKRRQQAKTGAHAVDYYCQARTLAGHLGITVHEAQQFIDRWLGAHPGIRRWHIRIEDQLSRTRSVSNAFGYKRHYFERTGGLLPEALAWIPQSTVACVINRAWLNIHNQAKHIQVLLQVHDSLAGQFPTHRKDESLKLLSSLSRITIPYPDPLIIPTGIKTSPRSWGDCV